MLDLLGFFRAEQSLLFVVCTCFPKTILVGSSLVKQPDEVPAVLPTIGLNRDNNFTLLRLILASLVILGHSPEIVDGDQHREILVRIFHHGGTFGSFSVAGFFLISGYMIVQSWERRPDLLDFLKKRVLRIYPAYAVSSLVAAFIVGPLAVTQVGQYFASFHIRSFIRGIVWLTGPEVPPVFAGLHYPVVNGPVWTIPHEFRCYLFVPLLGALGFVRNRNAWLIFSAVTLVYSLVSPAIPYHSLEPLLPKIVWYYLLPPLPLAQVFPHHLACFCVGGCFYLFRNIVRYEAKWAVVSVVLWAAAMFFDALRPVTLPIFGAYAVFWFAFARLPALSGFKRHADVSYGVYLYGWPVQSLCIWYFPYISPWLLFAVAWPLALGLGFLSWHLVELPFLRLKTLFSTYTLWSRKQESSIHDRLR